MADFIFASKKQYWAAIKNLHKNVNRSADSRKALYNITGNKIYKESEYNKRLNRGESYSIKQVRTDFKIAKDKAEKLLKADYLEAKKENVTNIKSFKEFKILNQQKDYAALYESYTSPK